MNEDKFKYDQTQKRESDRERCRQTDQSRYCNNEKCDRKAQKGGGKKSIGGTNDGVSHLISQLGQQRRDGQAQRKESFDQ